MERQIEKYDKDVQNQLKDVVFNVNQDVEKILNTSSGIAESYFRSRALISALNSYNVSSSSFSEISIEYLFIFSTKLKYSTSPVKFETLLSLVLA